MNANLSMLRGILDQLKSRLKGQSAEAEKRLAADQQRRKDLGSIHRTVDNLFICCFAYRRGRRVRGR